MAKSSYPSLANPLLRVLINRRFGAFDEEEYLRHSTEDSGKLVEQISLEPVG